MSSLLPSNYDVRIRRLGSLSASESPVLKVSDINFATQLSSTPTLSFSASLADIRNQGLDEEGVIFVVETFNGTEWKEHEQGRFVADDGIDYDDLDPTQMVDVTCTGWLSYISRKSYLDFGSPDPIEFSDVNPIGFIAWVCYNNVKARPGGLQGMDIAFTGELDSNGQPWAHSLTLTMEPDDSLLRVLDVLAENYLIEYTWKGNELVVLNPGTGVHRSLRIGRAATSIAIQKSLGNVYTHKRLVAQDGTTKVYPSGVDIGLGRLESAANASGVNSISALDLLGELSAQEAKPKQSIAVSENLDAAEYLPGWDYNMGDWVKLVIGGEEKELRVTGLQIRKADSGLVEMDVMLEDQLTSTISSLQRRAAALGARITGNGRQQTSVTSSGVRSRMATVTSGGDHPWIQFDGEVTPIGPVAFLSTYRPVTGHRVNVIEASGTMGTVNVISGKVVPEMEVLPPGYTELLTLAPGWAAYNPERYGPPRITLTASGIIRLGGCIKPIDGNKTQPVMFTVPAALMPFWAGGVAGEMLRWRRATMTYSSYFLADREEDAIVALNATTRQVYQTSDSGSTLPNYVGIELSRMGWFNVPFTWASTSSLLFCGYLKTSYGLVNGFALGNHPTAGVTVSYPVASDVPAPLATWGNRIGGSTSTLQEVQGSSNMTSSTSFSAAGSSIRPAAVWASDIWFISSDSTLDWVELDAINTYSPMYQAALAPDGLVLIRRVSGSSGVPAGGLSGWPCARLPVGMRPQYNTANVTSDGFIFPGSVPPNQMAFIQGN